MERIVITSGESDIKIFRDKMQNIVPLSEKNNKILSILMKAI